MSRSQPDLQLSQLSQVEVAIPIDQITSKKFHQFLTALRARRRMTGRVSQLHHHILPAGRGRNRVGENKV